MMPNYEVVKLAIGYPEWVNAALLGGVLILSFVFLKREQANFFAPSLTNQIKGAAMLLVVIGHIWAHVSDEQPVLVLGGHAVFTFLLISGFGLSMSSRAKSLPLAEYAKRRLARVLAPYWVATVFILAMDKLVLARSYHFGEVVLTFAGVNASPTLKHLDYVRWFISLLLAWYVLFYLFNRFLSRQRAIGFLVIAGVGLSVLERKDVFPFGAPYQIMAFPLGCLLAEYIGPVQRAMERCRHAFWFPLLLVCMVLMQYVDAGIQPVEDSPAYLKILGILAPGCTSLLLTLSLVAWVHLLARYALASRFLSWTGTISYELFLLHGALLIKYNPVLGAFPDLPIAILLIIWLTMILVLAAIFHGLVAKMDRIVFQSTARLLIAAVAIFFVAITFTRTNLLCQVCDKIGVPYAKVYTYPSAHYSRMLTFHERMDGSIPDRAILFIGDSITQSLCVSAVHPEGVNLGIGSDSTDGVLDRLGNHASLERAQLIVLAVGVNDVNRGHERDIMTNYIAILDALPPRVPVLISAILPVDQVITGRQVNATIRSINQQLSDLAASRAGCHFFDSGMKLIDAELNLKDPCHLGDGVHLSTAGYAIWINDLKSAIRTLGVD